MKLMKESLKSLCVIALVIALPAQAQVTETVAKRHMIAAAFHVSRRLRPAGMAIPRNRQDHPRITKGAHLRFDQGSAKQLGELLRAVAAFAVGGITSLEKQNSNAAKLLLGQIR